MSARDDAGVRPPEQAAGLEVSIGVRDRGLAVDLTVARGEVLAVLGPNGAGKSTLLEVLAGLVRPDSGHIRWNGRALTDIDAGVAVPPHRREISLLAQDPLLFPHLSASANVAFGPRSRGVRPRAAAARARDWLTAVDAESLAERRPGELSGGQAQRVALARALAVEPRMVLLDEPMSALDVTVAPAMRALLRRVLRERREFPQHGDVGRGDVGQRDVGQGDAHRLGAVLVTHDIVDALTLADRAVVLESGRVVEQGPVAAVLARPRSAFAARIAGVNLMIGTAVAGDGVTGPPRQPAVGAVRCGDDVVHGCCDTDWVPGPRAAAVFSPAAVAVHRDPPTGSPRNVLRVRVTELTDRGGIVRVHSDDRPDGTPGPVADLTPASVAELGLAPGIDAYLAVKTTEVQVYPC